MPVLLGAVGEPIAAGSTPKVLAAVGGIAITIGLVIAGLGLASGLAR
jgi:hypothetical protein